MKPSTTDEVMDLLDGAATSAAAGAAMELGLFWLLDASALDTREVAEALKIPPIRCGYWLQLLAEAGLLERNGTRFRTSAAAHRAVVDAFSAAAWALLAEEARERLQALRDLPRHLRAAGPSPDGLQATISGAYHRMAADPEAARRFTRMLYEVHLPLARELAAFLDLGSARRLMDLGGGSGVMSLELVRRYPALSATVVDLATVCGAGEEIMAAEGADRVSFHPADFARDALPTGFDVVFECDVNVYSDELLRKVRDALAPGGRYLIVDQFASSPGEAAPSRVQWAFTGSMIDPAYTAPSLPWIRSLLEGSGFRIASESRFEASPAARSRLARGLTVIDARAAD